MRSFCVVVLTLFLFGLPVSAQPTEPPSEAGIAPRVNTQLGSMKEKPYISAAILRVGLLSSRSEALELVQLRDWKVRFVMGSGLEGSLQENSKMSLILGERSILCETDSGGGFLIPVQQVVGVTYDNVVMRRYHLWEASSWAPYAMFEGWRSRGGWFYTGDHAHYLDVLLWSGTMFALTESFKSKDHFVNILWRDGDRAKEVIFELGKKDYLSLLDRLQDTTGEAWLNLPDAREGLRQDLEKHRDQAIPVQLDRAVSYQEILIEPGLYQLVLLQGEQHGALSFFRGPEVNTGEVFVVVPVEVAAGDEKVGVVEVIYREPTQGRLATIAEIRVGRTVLRFP